MNQIDFKVLFWFKTIIAMALIHITVLFTFLSRWISIFWILFTFEVIVCVI